MRRWCGVALCRGPGALAEAVVEEVQPRSVLLVAKCVLESGIVEGGAELFLKAHTGDRWGVTRVSRIQCGVLFMLRLEGVGRQRMW